MVDRDLELLRSSQPRADCVARSEFVGLLGAPARAGRLTPIPFHSSATPWPMSRRGLALHSGRTKSVVENPARSDPVCGFLPAAASPAARPFSLFHPST